MTSICPNRVPKIAVVGAFQNGKSTLVNCLLDDKYSPMGKGVRTTACCTYFLYGEAEIAKLCHGVTQKSEILDRREAIFGSGFSCDGSDYLEISCWKPILQKAILIDTPGFDANKRDDEAAQDAINKSDIIIFVHDARQLDDCAFRILKRIQRAGKRLLCLMNCTNPQNWHPSDKWNLEISRVIESQLSEIGYDSSLIRIQERKVWTCNPVFAWYALGHLQRDLDSNQESVKSDAKDLFDDVMYFCKKRKWAHAEQKKQLLTASGVLEIRRIIENSSMASLWNLCKSPFDEVRALTEKWTLVLKNVFSNLEVEARK